AVNAGFRDRAPDARLCGHYDVIANADVAVHADLSAQRHAAAYDCTPRNSGLRNDQRVRPDPHIVTNVDQVVDLHIIADLGCPHGAPVDRRVCAHLNIAAQNAAAHLRDLPVRALTPAVAVPIRANAG